MPYVLIVLGLAILLYWKWIAAYLGMVFFFVVAVAVVGDCISVWCLLGRLYSTVLGALLMPGQSFLR